MKAIAVGGTWDPQGGRPSKLFERLVEGFMETYPETQSFNGGELSALMPHLLEFIEAGSPDVLIWMPDISNDEHKLLDRLKVQFPRTILIGSKRLDGRSIGLPEVVDRMLQVKMNLCLVFDRKGDKFQGTILDPLGNVFSAEDETDFNKLGFEIGARARYLQSVRRVGSESLGEADWAREGARRCDPEFFQVIREYAAEFDRLVPRPEKVSRFLGNAAFRCTHGFPAYRDAARGLIYVSRRNVDKGGIGPGEFVPVVPYRPYDSKVSFYGTIKPSVDTPINLLLFDYFTEVNFLIHGHVYATNGLFTKRVVPCGAIEEFEAIREALDDRPDLPWFEVNLRGHGCIIAGRNIDDLCGVQFYARPTEERIGQCSDT